MNKRTNKTTGKIIDLMEALKKSLDDARRPTLDSLTRDAAQDLLNDAQGCVWDEAIIAAMAKRTIMLKDVHDAGDDPNARYDSRETLHLGPDE